MSNLRKIAHLSQNVVSAHAFERLNRAHPSVSTDQFSTAPKTNQNAPPGTLLNGKADQCVPLAFTLYHQISPSTNAHYQSQTSSGSLVPVSACISWTYVARSYWNVNGHPLVAGEHGTSGSNTECAPSNNKNLWHQFQAPYQLMIPITKSIISHGVKESRESHVEKHSVDSYYPSQSATSMNMSISPAGRNVSCCFFGIQLHSSTNKYAQERLQR